MSPCVPFLSSGQWRASLLVSWWTLPLVLQQECLTGLDRGLWFSSPARTGKQDRTTFCWPLLAVGQCPHSLERPGLDLWLVFLGTGNDNLKVERTWLERHRLPFLVEAFLGRSIKMQSWAFEWTASTLNFVSTFSAVPISGTDSRQPVKETSMQSQARIPGTVLPGYLETSPSSWSAVSE